jgi:hypothetical protein
MIHLINFSAMALYLGAWILLLRALSSQKKSASRPFEIMLTYLAVMAHGLTLAPPILLEETPNLALGTTLSLIVFLIVTLFSTYLFAGIARFTDRIQRGRRWLVDARPDLPIPTRGGSRTDACRWRRACLRPFKSRASTSAFTGFSG